MNSFRRQSLVEARSLAILTPFLEEKAYKGRFVLCMKGALAKALQEVAGDALFNTADGVVWSVELKADDTDYDNAFLETFSNKNLDSRESHAARGSKAGWLFSNGADILLYHRLQYDELRVLSLLKLKRWAFGHNGEPIGLSGHAGRIYDFKERKQQSVEQLNDTWGRPVPWLVLEREVPHQKFSVRQLTLWEQGEVA